MMLQSIVLVYQNTSSMDKNIQKLVASDNGPLIKLSQGSLRVKEKYGDSFSKGMLMCGL